MKLNDILSPGFDAGPWESKGYALPRYDIAAVAKKTHERPAWLHFGPGNIFRAFHAAIASEALDRGLSDVGIIAAECFDYELIDRIYRPNNNLSLLVSLCSCGSVKKKVIASITESLKADPSFEADWARMREIFRAPSLQLVTFTITEKGYTIEADDLQRGLQPALAMGKLAVLLYERFLAGCLPLTLQSTDNCSHNGDKIKSAVTSYAKDWAQSGLVPKAFLDYLLDEGKIAYPWSMIDKITPRPHQDVQRLLAADGFEDSRIVVTEKKTVAAPFVNAEEDQYLVIEDHYTNGRPPLEAGGAMFASREVVNQVEAMKVTACLNPLHTAMAIFGCLLDYKLISAEMADKDIRVLVEKLAYAEAMKVVTNPGVLNPSDFAATVISRRFPNPFMPDTPQRIATDTSQKLSIRFGETIKRYVSRGMGTDHLVLIPLTLAAYTRYLKGLDDAGNAFEPSPDPLLTQLQAIVAPLELGRPEQDFRCLETLLSRSDIFGVNLYEVGLGEKTAAMARELYAGVGAVRSTLHKYVSSF